MDDSIKKKEAKKRYNRKYYEKIKNEQEKYIPINNKECQQIQETIIEPSPTVMSDLMNHSYNGVMGATSTIIQTALLTAATMLMSYFMKPPQQQQQPLPQPSNTHSHPSETLYHLQQSL